MGLERLPFVEKETVKVTKNWALFRVKDMDAFKMNDAIAAVPAQYKVTGTKKGAAIP